MIKNWNSVLNPESNKFLSAGK